MGALASTDAALQNALSSITTYFTSNIGIVISAVIGVLLLLWFVRMALGSTGAKRAKGGPA